MATAIPPDPAPTLPEDRLLEREELQGVVAHQTARDVPALVELLAHPDPELRARAAFALGSVQAPDAVPALLPLLGDPEAAVRRDAAFALGQSGDPLTVPRLLAALEVENDPEVRGELLEAVARVGEGDAMAALGRLAVGAGEARSWLLALGRFGARGLSHPAGVETLAEALSLPEPALKEAAAYFFGRHPEPTAWTLARRRVRAAVDEARPHHLALVHLLTGLGRLGEVEDLPRFIRWSSQATDWRIRVAAVNALQGQGASREARDALLRALEDPSPQVAVAAATALSDLRGLAPGEVGRIRGRVERSRDPWPVAVPLLSALVANGEGGRVVAWLQRRDPAEAELLRNALPVLARIPGEGALGLLLQGADSPDPRVAGGALAGLAARWEADREESAHHVDYYRRFQAGARLPDRRGAVASLTVLQDPAFIALGSLDVLEAYLPLLTAPEDAGLRETIRESLLREGREPPPPGVGTEGGEARLPEVDWEWLGSLGRRPALVLETERGEVELLLVPGEAPLTVSTILGFARDGLYDGVPFHRVVPGFVMQGGDFQFQDGTGGPGFSIRSEFTRIPFRRGTVGMARSGKDTEGSQFFITHGMQPHLDPGYTAFGWVVGGMDVVDRIVAGDRIVRARVEPSVH